jgi:nitrogenase molybdenum-iron protein alpha/beta subunit
VQIFFNGNKLRKEKREDGGEDIWIKGNAMIYVKIKRKRGKEREREEGERKVWGTRHVVRARTKNARAAIWTNPDKVVISQKTQQENDRSIFLIRGLNFIAK